MISLPQAGIGGYTSSLSTQHRSIYAEANAVKEDANGQKTLVSASVSSSVSLSNSFNVPTRSHTFAPTGIEKYQAIGGQDQQGAAAATILNFIEQRLQKDIDEGASAEELQARLEEGLEGFLKGYGEAVDQLSEMGLLEDEVKAAVEKTYDSVSSGFQRMAEKYGLEAPAELNENESEVVSTRLAETDFRGASAVEQVSQLFESTDLNYDSYQSRSFSFEVKTADGDTVTIRANSEVGNSINYGYEQGGMSASREAMSASRSSSDQFSFSVNGELDEGELKAINDLLSQVNRVSTTFFNGDVFSAFEQALEVGYDSEEITRFSLNLRQEGYTQVDSSYKRIADPGASTSASPGNNTFAGSPVAQLGDFVQQLEEARQNALKLSSGVELLTDLTHYMAQEKYAGHERLAQFKPFVEDVLGSLSRL